MSFWDHKATTSDLQLFDGDYLSTLVEGFHHFLFSSIFPRGPHKTTISLRPQISFLFLPSSHPHPLLSRDQPFPYPVLHNRLSLSAWRIVPRSRTFIMDISLIYAIIIGGSFGLLLLINVLPLIARLVRYLSPLVSKHLIYRYILHRHQLLGPWSRADVLVQLIYIAGNICCFEFWDTTISQVGLRAGTLAMINLIPLFAVPHLSTLADLR